MTINVPFNALSGATGDGSGSEGAAIQLKRPVMGAAATVESSSPGNDAETSTTELEFDEERGKGQGVVAGDEENVPPVITEQLANR